MLRRASKLTHENLDSIGYYNDVLRAYNEKIHRKYAFKITKMKISCSTVYYCLTYSLLPCFSFPERLRQMSTPAIVIIKTINIVPKAIGSTMISISIVSRLFVTASVLTGAHVTSVGVGGGVGDVSVVVIDDVGVAPISVTT